MPSVRCTSRLDIFDNFKSFLIFYYLEKYMYVNPAYVMIHIYFLGSYLFYLMERKFRMKNVI